MPLFEIEEELTLHYAWVGPRSARHTVLFLHDGLGSVGAWGEVPTRICEQLNWRGLVYDRLGYGESSRLDMFEPGLFKREADRLLHLLDHLELDRPHLVGHSDGGSIALLFSATYVDRVSSVVAEAAHTFVEPTTRNGLMMLLETVQRDGLPGWLLRQHGDRAAHLFKTWTDLWLGTDQVDFDIRPQLRRLQTPALLVQGLEDEYGTIDQLASLLSIHPEPWLWAPAGCGHVPHSELEDEFCRRVTQFLSHTSG